MIYLYLFNYLFDLIMPVSDLFNYLFELINACDLFILVQLLIDLINACERSVQLLVCYTNFFQYLHNVIFVHITYCAF